MGDWLMPCDVGKQVYEPAIFTFWAKSAVDVEQRCIRLQSSSYTTSAILDTITAACVQVRGVLKPSYLRACVPCFVGTVDGELL